MSGDVRQVFDHGSVRLIETWGSDERIVEAARMTEHARAGDNPVQRHPRPSWLPERPWQGPSQGIGAFAGPSGTAIP